jgi:hypothetical protein
VPLRLMASSSIGAGIVLSNKRNHYWLAWRCQTLRYPHWRAVKERYRTACPVVSPLGGGIPAPRYWELCATISFLYVSPIPSTLPVTATPHLRGSHLASRCRLPTTPSLPRVLETDPHCLWDKSLGSRVVRWHTRQHRTAHPRHSGKRRAGALEAANPTRRSIRWELHRLQR